MEAAGDGGTTLTGADGPYNDEAFRAKTGPHFQLVSSPVELTTIPMPVVNRVGAVGQVRWLEQVVVLLR